MNFEHWGLLGQTANLLAGDSELNPTALAYCLLALAGAELSDRLPSSERSDRENLNLFVLLVGASGVTRKSSAMSRVATFWRNFISPAGDTKTAPSPLIIEGVGSGEGLARLLAGGSEQVPVRACLLYDEVMQFAQKASIDGSSLLSIFNQLYDGRSWENQVKRSDHSVQVDNAVLSFIGAATPEVYGDLWSKAGLGMGVLNRYLLVPIEPTTRPVFWPSFPTNDQKDAIGKQWRDRIAKGEQFLQWTPEAKQACQAWYERARVEPVTTSRLDEQLKRLIALNCWFRDVTVVDAAVAGEAVAMVEEQQRVRIEFWAHTNPWVRRIEEALRKGPATNRELYRMLHAERAAREFVDALDMIERIGLVKKRMDNSGKIWHWELV